MPKLRLFSATKMLREDEKTMRPFTAISPDNGRSRPAMERSVVVLPHPDGPSRVKNFPFSTSNATSRTARKLSPRPVRYSVFSEVTFSTGQTSLRPMRRPKACAASTKTKSAAISMTPRAESSTYWPFCHISHSTTETTSLSGL